MALSQVFYDAQLTPVRLCSTANISATYSNGAVNNGVGATLTVAASSLTVDSVAAAVGDRVLVHNQTNTYENGLYFVTSIGTEVVLTRTEDFHSTSQMLLGQHLQVYAGTVNTGKTFVLSARPDALGVDTLTFSAVAGGVSGSTVADEIPVAADTTGTIKSSAGVSATLGGSLQADGAIQAGKSGTAGALTSYPAAASFGSLSLTAVNNGGDFAVVISNAAYGQATTLTIPDVAAATGSILVSAVAADTGANLISFDVTVGQADLASGGQKILYDSSASKQYKVRELFINAGGTDFSGGGGDRLAHVSDGTTAYSLIPAANLQTLTNGRWGDTNMPFPALGGINVSTAAGADLIIEYSGGATDYTAGSVVISGILERVA